MKDDNMLPEGWKRVKVSSVGQLIRGINYTKDLASNTPFKNSLPILRANNINGELNNDDLVYIPKDIVRKEQLIKKDDIVFAMSSGSKHLVGKSAVAKGDFLGSFGAFCAMLRVNETVDKKYIAYILKGNSLRKLISEIAKGTNINNLKREHILDFEFPLPPTNVQKSIVSKIEELFSELDKGIENLRIAKQQLKTYRQAVLKWAFEGRLTNENVKEGELPESWRFTSMGEVIEKPKYGTSKKCEYGIKGIGVLRIPNIVKGIVDSVDLKFAKFEKQEIKTYNLKEGDILTIRSNGSVDIVGKCALVTKKDVGFLYAGYLIRLRPEQKLVLPKYLIKILSSIKLRNQIEEKAKSTSGVNNINSEELAGLIIAIPPLYEQHYVIQEIESRLSLADKMEESITQSLEQSEELRQSILKKAFEGKLV